MRTSGPYSLISFPFYPFHLSCYVNPLFSFALLFIFYFLSHMTPRRLLNEMKKKSRNLRVSSSCLFITSRLFTLHCYVTRAWDPLLVQPWFLPLEACFNGFLTSKCQNVELISNLLGQLMILEFSFLEACNVAF